MIALVLMQRFYQQLVLVFIPLILGACALLDEESQFTKKMTAPAFVAELYGCQTQVLALSHEEASYVEWLGFIQSNDYEYFKITKVVSGSKVIVEDGEVTDGKTYTASSNAIIEDFSVAASRGDDEDSDADGSISVAGSSDLQMSVEYCPLTALEGEEEAHTANLIVNYSVPQTGSVRITLDGYVQGIKDEKCAQDPSTMEAIAYQVVGGAFDLYFCSEQVAKYDQNNTTQDEDDPSYHGASTNVASIELTDPTFTFYQVDSETVCLLTDPTPSIPTFDLPIPDIGDVPIDVMEDIHMAEGSFAECSLTEGVITCQDNIQIEALVSLSEFTLTNDELTASELKTSDCPDFGAISGSGNFGDGSDLTLVIAGTTISDTNTETYDIVDSLIVAEIELEFVGSE